MKRNNPLPRKGALVKIRAKHKNSYGEKPLVVIVEGVVLGVSERGLLLRDRHHNQARLFRAEDVIDFTPLVPGDEADAYFGIVDMQDHVRQVGRPAVDMIQNPDPKESSW